ncbi:choice-of-anchor J domain-containing protein, partial [Myxococcota bacterium]|nr:choice-of-anchor J domain-containing protein [Myxococcota bacterium]MBU1538122.1 choice-of-anchor J domain-containing protein [Myxococcota bacterium]
NAICPTGDIVLSETFDGTTIPTGWVVEDGSTDGETWYNAGGYMMADSDAAGSGVHLVEGLITPAIDLSGYSTVLLSFELDYNCLTSDRLYVQVSTDGTAYTTVKTYSADFYGLESLDISADAAGQSTVYVRFLYDDFSTWAWEVVLDNVIVEGM